MIPIMDLKKQIAPLRAQIDAAIKEIIDNTDFILGKEVSVFEEAVKKYCNVKFAAGVSNGTDALRLSLVALGVKPGDAVICPAFTYYASAGAIASIGALPVFTDIDPKTYNIDPVKLEAVVISKKHLPIKAIIVVHLYGQCADMDRILEIAKKYKLKVVEDSAQAFGAQYRGKKSATLGDCGAISFFPGKNLGAFGDAGMVLTDSQAIEEKIKIFRNQGNRDRYHHLVIGYNNRMDSIQAAVLNVKLKFIDLWNKKRQENAEYYNRRLESGKITLPFVAPYSTHIYHQYVLRLKMPSRDLVEHLRKKEIDARVYYPVPLHLQECFKDLGYKKGDFPESESAAQETFAIPVYPDLTKEEMDYIIVAIKEFIK